jgi:ribonucleotide monophosphatase NagD (HAD superfamily)
MDARFPVAEGQFDPGCGALAEAVAVAAGVRPMVVGKPHRPLFEVAIQRLGCKPHEVAMVGDNHDSDIAGGRAAGMFTVWVDARSETPASMDADLKVGSLLELHKLWQDK